MVKRRHSLVLLGCLLLALLIWAGLMHQFRLDDSFITYRYAQNAARGAGLVYNQGDATLSTTAPLYALLLSLLSRIIHDFHVLGGLFGVVCIGLGGGVLYLLLPGRMSHSVRVWAALIYTLSTPLWLALGMETPLWIMMVLAAILAAQHRRWGGAGLLIGIATLVRPDAALPGLLLGVVILIESFNQIGTRSHWFTPALYYALAGALPVILFALWGLAAYGSPLPVTLSAKGAQAVLGITGLGPFVGIFDGLGLIISSLVAQSPFYVLFAALLLVGLRGLTSWPAALLAAWGVLHLIVYAVLRIAPYRWYYTPLLPGVIILAAHGLDFLVNRVRKRVMTLPKRWSFSPEMAGLLFIVGTLLAPVMSFGRIHEYFQRGGPSDVMLPIVDWDAYRQVGDWLRLNTPENATVGVAEVGQVGFYADRWMTDYLGLLQTDAADMLRRGDLYSWLARYAPDYLVFQRFRGAPLVLYNYLIGDDPWFVARYKPVAEFDDARYSSGPVTVFERAADLRPLSPHSAQADYEGLQLVGLAAENYELLQKDRTLRIRLDWNVRGILPENLHLAVKLLDLDPFPSFDADYGTTQWRGAFSTWHTLVLPQEIASGAYPLHVAVGPTGGPYLGQDVSEFVIP